MGELNKIKINGTEYNIVDATHRSQHAIRNSSFLAFSSDAYFESDFEKGVLFLKFQTIIVRGSIAQTIGWDKSFNDVATACGLTPVTSTKGVTGCLCLPDGYVISYCLTDDTIKYGHWSNTAIKDPNCIVIIAQSKGRFVDGLYNALVFMNEETRGMIKELKIP